MDDEKYTMLSGPARRHAEQSEKQRECWWQLCPFVW